MRAFVTERRFLWLEIETKLQRFDKKQTRLSLQDVRRHDEESTGILERAPERVF